MRRVAHMVRVAIFAATLFFAFVARRFLRKCFGGWRLQKEARCAALARSAQRHDRDTPPNASVAASVDAVYAVCAKAAHVPLFYAR